MRRLLPLVVLGVLSACTAQAPGGPEPASTAPNLSPPRPLYGAWRSSIDVKSGAFTAAKGLEFMYVFHIGGTLTESSNYDAAPPAYGVFRFVPGDGRVWEAKYEFFTTAPSPTAELTADSGWLPSGRGVFTERITVAPDGRTFTSTIRYQLFDANGAAIEGGGEATGRGVRIDF